MADLTQEYFDRHVQGINKKLDGLVTKDELVSLESLVESRFVKIESRLTNLATKEELKLGLVQTENRILAAVDKKIGIRIDNLTGVMDKKIESKIDWLAGVFARGFEDIQSRLDVRDRVGVLETDMSRIKGALHID